MRPFKVALVDSGEPSHLVPAWVCNALALENIDFLVQGCESTEDLAAHASDSDLVWVWGSRILRQSRLDVLGNCGAILRSGSGTDNVPVAEATQRNVLVINTPGAVAQEVSEHTIALLLSVVRQTAATGPQAGTWPARLGEGGARALQPGNARSGVAAEPAAALRVLA